MITINGLMKSAETLKMLDKLDVEDHITSEKSFIYRSCSALWQGPGLKFVLASDGLYWC